MFGTWQPDTTEIEDVFIRHKLDSLAILGGVFAYDASLDLALQSEDGIWLSDESIEVMLKIDKAIAPTSHGVKLIANQVGH